MAVWKSGIEIRTAQHIVETKDENYFDLAKNLITDAENILKMPDGTMEIFTLRLDELNQAKDIMKKSGL